MTRRSGRWIPGQDRRAVRHPGASGSPRPEDPKHVVVIGGGIAGLAAATILAERGVQVTLLEREAQLGGRVRSWPVGEPDDQDPAPRTMSRGFHAFFRQYYTLRALLRRADPALQCLHPVADYPLQLADGPTDSFAEIGRTPPWSIINFVRKSPTFPVAALTTVNVAAALELVRTRFPQTFVDHDGESAQAFLDRLNFPQQARHLALEVFARSFFADPNEFSAGELVGMFHTYFTGSAEGLVFDVPTDDYDLALWAPLGRYLGRLGVTVRIGTEVTGVSLGEAPQVVVADEVIGCDAIVLATEPAVTRRLVAGLADPGLQEWQTKVAAIRNAPPFVVWRLWLDRPVAESRKAFLGTAGFGPLDNVTVLERFEHTAATWRAKHGGSVVELHAYAVEDPDETTLRAELRHELGRVFPETVDADIVHDEFLIRSDCGLVGLEPWAGRAGVKTPDPRLVLAGDTIRCEFPVALMERAAVTGVQAANALLAVWGVAGEDVWTVPMKGLLG